MWSLLESMHGRTWAKGAAAVQRWAASRPVLPALSEDNRNCLVCLQETQRLQVAMADSPPGKALSRAGKWIRLGPCWKRIYKGS